MRLSATRLPLIHIGLPKCASTWLQKHYFNSRHGYHRVYGPLKSQLAFAAPPPFSPALPDTPHLQPRNGVTPVITGESLAGNPLSGGANAEIILHRLKRSVPQAKILIVIREQRSMLRSLYQLLVNWGSPIAIEDLLVPSGQPLVPRFDLKFLCYDKIIAAYQQSFGVESVLVLTYEALLVDPGAFLRAISEFSDIDLQRYPVSADFSRRENPSRSLASLAIKRWHNRFIARTAFNPHGLYTPEQIQGAANVSIALPEVLERWQEARFAACVDKLTRDFYTESNTLTEQLTGLSLGDSGYQLPSITSSPVKCFEP